MIIPILLTFFYLLFFSEIRLKPVFLKQAYFLFFVSAFTGCSFTAGFFPNLAVSWLCFAIPFLIRFDTGFPIYHSPAFLPRPNSRAHIPAAISS
jgi:hypothetical protein